MSDNDRCPSLNSGSIPIFFKASRSSASPARRPSRPTRFRRPSGQGRACPAQTGSGKTAAFLLPILHRLIDKPRGTTRALVLTPTRELAAQILEDLNDLAVHTPITGAAVFGGVGMGPQEHAFRSGVDVIVATPGPAARSLPRSRTRSSTGLEYLVLDEADRMLDMGFLPDIRRDPAAPPGEAADAVLQRDDAAADRGARRARCCSNPVTINLRAAGGAGGRHHAGGLSGAAGAEGGAAASSCSSAATCSEALVFTRTKHRANRLAEYLVQQRHQGRAHPRQPLAGAAHRRRSPASRAAGTACSSRPTSPRAASTSRRSATSSTSTCPRCPRTTSTASAAPARAEATGEAFTFVVAGGRGRPARASSARSASALPRVTRAGLRLHGAAAAKLEVPLAQRIAEIRARKAEERARAPPTPHGAPPRIVAALCHRRRQPARAAGVHSARHIQGRGHSGARSRAWTALIELSESTEETGSQRRNEGTKPCFELADARRPLAGVERARPDLRCSVPSMKRLPPVKLVALVCVHVRPSLPDDLSVSSHPRRVCGEVRLVRLTTRSHQRRMTRRAPSAFYSRSAG